MARRTNRARAESRTSRILTLALWSVLGSGCSPIVLIGYDSIESDAGGLDASEPEGPEAEPDPIDAAPEPVDAAPEPVDAASEDAGPPDAAWPDNKVRGDLSGLAWPSGAHYGNEPPSYTEFGRWRGRPLDVAAVYPPRETWDSLMMPGWPVDLFQSFPGTLVMSYPLYPPGLGNNRDCAAGMYDDQWKKLGSFLTNRNRGESIIRLGWGPTDPTHAWRSDPDPTSWIACFRKIVLALHSTAPRLVIDWSFDPIPSAIPQSGDPYDTYPGDDYVNVVGMDAFDRLPPNMTEAAWNAKCSGPLGLCTLAEFARVHDKKLSVGEWGVATCGESPGGDNRLYIKKMVDTFRRYSDILAYEAYFDDADAEICSSIVNASASPNASAEYLSQYAKKP